MRRRGWWIGVLLTVSLLGGEASAQVGELVSDLVGQVSQANLVAHLEALEGDRSTPASQALAAAYIRAELESYGYTVTSQPVAGSENVIASLVGGSHPDREFVLGAHFDTVPGSPGADDDASGVAAVLETARILAAQPARSTVHFVLFALEESGYQGSEAYAASLAAAGGNVVGMISLDMIGYTCSTPGCQIVLPDIPGCLESQVESNVGDFIGLGANAASTSLLEALLANAALYEPALPIESFVIQGNGTCFPDSRRSDHKSFWDEGYPAIILGDGAEARNPNYHQASDTSGTLDAAFLTSVTRAVVGHVAVTALSAPALPSLAPAGLLALAVGLLASGALAARRPR